MSIQRKFLIAITVVIAAFAVVIAIITSISASSEAEDKISQQKEQLSARLTNILTVTDSLMHERVVSSMKLLKERGDAMGIPSQGGEVMVKQTQLLLEILLVH